MKHGIPQTTAKLAATLRHMADSVEALDSFEGTIRYEACEEGGMFMVEAFYRVGNADGQGGSRVIGKFGS